MQLLLALVCDEAGLNPEGKLDVHGVFNDLYAPGFPAKQDRMVLALVVEWDREDQGRFRFRVDLEDDTGKPTLSVEGYSDVDARPADRPPPRTRLVMPLEEVVFPRPGAYTFRLSMKGQTLQGPSIYLVEASEAPPPQ
ncbi:MAG TPA: hypothetical protein VLA36_07080 [Longimicrobiales bacterium]|nr:hypothetical protein [Longimicrobiales bacterium]